MPALNLEQLDDPMLTDVCPSFNGGQVSYGPPDQLAPMQAAALVNIDIYDGTATTRRGAQQLDVSLGGSVQGLFWYDTPAHEYLVGIGNGASQVYDETSWADGIGNYAPGTTTAQVCMAQLIEKLYIAGGQGTNLNEWDGSSLVDLGNTTGTPGNPPSDASLVISAYGALWLAGFTSAPDTLWVSNFLDAGTTGWNATYGNIRVGQGEGDPITGLCEWDDFQIVVFKRNSIYVLRINPRDLTMADASHGLGTASLTKISDTIGCVSHRSIARVGSDIWFLSDAGVFSVGRVLAQTQREVKQAASLPIQDVINRVNWKAASTAAACFWNNRYLLSLPLDDDTAPSVVMVYNTQRQAWGGMWTGWSPTCWALSKAGGDERLNFGRTNGAVWRWMDYVQAENATEASFRDNGQNLGSSVTTRAMIFADAVSPKSALNVQAEFFGSEAAATVSVRLDEQEPIALKTAFDSSTGSLLLPFMLPAILPGSGLKRRAFGAQHLEQFRSMQVVVDSPSGKMALRGIIATGFLDSIKLEI